MIYQPKNGSHISKDGAQVLGERIAVLAQNGALRPEDIVEDARPASSPLHPYFEWDDRVAADRYRVSQAGYYLRNIEIVRDNEEPIRAFHVVTLGEEGEENERGYVTLSDVLSNQELLTQVIVEEGRRLEAIAKTLAQYQALSAIVQGPLRATIAALKNIQLVEAL